MSTQQIPWQTCRLSLEPCLPFPFCNFKDQLKTDTVELVLKRNYINYTTQFTLVPYVLNYIYLGFIHY